MNKIGIATLFDPRFSAYFFSAGLFMVYGIAPLLINQFFPNNYYLLLAGITTVSCCFILLGFKINFVDQLLLTKRKAILVNGNTFHLVIWSSFLLFAITALVTAPSIPIISALTGSGMNELSDQRGEFLKMRSGAEIVLLYLSTLYTTALLPYSLAGMFLEKTRFRFLALIVFLFFSISFLQKGLFLNLIFPLIFVFLRNPKNKIRNFILLISFSMGLLYFLTHLTMKEAVGVSKVTESIGVTGFFSVNYVPTGILDILFWRSIAVPLFTASDTLVVFFEQFGGNNLNGATSSLLAFLFGLERVPLEVMVHAHQFGGWNAMGNANAVFMVDAFVNFGWSGVVIFSLFVGQSLRWFAYSLDDAFRSLWMVYCFVLFSATLIGMLFSNGYLYIFIQLFLMQIKSPSNKMH